MKDKILASIERISGRIHNWAWDKRWKGRRVYSSAAPGEKVYQAMIQLKESDEHFKKYIEKGVVFHTASGIREYAIKNSIFNDKEKNNFYLEFGVFKGETANFFSKFINKLYAFDSFEGLKEDWSGMRPKGTFNLNKQIPKLNKNIEPIVGWIEDSLEDFLKKHNPKINFVHMDLDTYESTKYTLEKIKPYLVKNATLIFDELYNFPGWRHGEYKALTEVFINNEYVFKAFNVRGYQAVIQIKEDK